MFKTPQRYVVGNVFLGQHVLEYLQEYKSKLKWDLKPNSSLLDIGCGPCDITMDYVEPLLSKDYKAIVGVDLIEENINFAKKTYEGKYPRTKFEVMDIADKDLKIKEQFDHVTSFYCLNFVQDQSQAINNVYSLVKPGGDIFLLLMAQCHFFCILDILRANPRFNAYMKEVSSYSSPYRYSETPAEDFAQQLKKAGFKDVTCKAKRSYYIYKKHQVDNHLACFDILKPGTSEDIRCEVNKAFYNTINDLELVKEESRKSTYRFMYNNFIAHAKK